MTSPPLCVHGVAGVCSLSHRCAGVGAPVGARAQPQPANSKLTAETGVEVEIVQVEQPEEIKAFGVHATPAVVIDGQVVHSGGIPSHEAVAAWLKRAGMGFVNQPTRHLFFTGKGGVGKTSLSAATALMLAEAGKRVLLVSTDAASNLDDMLGMVLRNTPVLVPGVPGLSVLNIDPDNAAESYRQRVLAQMGTGASAEDLSTVREQLSGACTTEIASLDEFSSLLADGSQAWDHIVFDTAPTGHTLRLLSLPKAWTGSFDSHGRGASCLGPHSSLKMQEIRFNAALEALCDPSKTTVVLVTRPDRGAIAEAARTSIELRELGLANQRLVINGIFHAGDRRDAVACAIDALGQQALKPCPQRWPSCRRTGCRCAPSTPLACRPCARCWFLAQRQRPCRPHSR